MAAVAELIAEHRELEDHAARLARIADLEVPDAAAVARVRWQMAQLLFDHLRSEDRMIYDRLLVSGDAVATGHAWAFRREHGALGFDFTHYIGDWPVARIARVGAVPRGDARHPRSARRPHRQRGSGALSAGPPGKGTPRRVKCPPAVEPVPTIAHKAPMRRRGSFRFSPLILAACGLLSASSVAAQVAPGAPQRPSADWRDWPLTPGTWVYRQDARGSIALFGRTGEDAELTLRCDRQRGVVYLSRRADTAAALGLTLRTSSQARTLNALPTGGATPYVAVELGVRDPLLDAIGYSRGRFIVEGPGLATLVLPAWAEILRIAEDCRG